MAVLYILLKTLPTVCMKYITQGESWVANIAWGKSQDSHQEWYIFIQSGNAWSVLLYLTLYYIAKCLKILFFEI